jgi:hypothetical protein
MANAFDPAELLEFHRRLIAGDRLAPDAFARRFLPYLVAETTRKFAQRYGHLVYDGAIDAFLDFCAHPDRFDPSRETSVEGCLLNAAWCNVDNLIVSERRLKAREQRVGQKNPEISVAFDPVARKIKQEEDRRKAADLEEILSALNDKDQEFYKLHMQGTRATGVFAKFLQIEHLPVKQQRKEVKRHKDRIRSFLKRKGLLP